MKYILTIIFAFFLVGCSDEDLKVSIAPKEESSFAKDYLDQLRLKNYEYIKAQMHPELLNKATIEELEELSRFFPDGEPLKTELMGFNIHTINSIWSANFSFESQFQVDWSVASVSMTKEDGKLLVTGFHVYRTNESQKVLNAFGNVELSVTRLVLLVLTIATPIFMVVTCFFVYRTPIEKKWRWYVLSFVGIGAVFMNWTTGEIVTKIATIKLLGVGASAASEFAPLIFTFTIPIGAIIFWIKRGKMIEQALANKAN
ncbi:hypothetical protein A7985_07930 [Pseudoalteromonas luteoviolacea]|uniref:Uncharacterized protein n=1 Tax=Pseudoalteromonas luteoviolacea TaxID=43657 RepID=A0A1C0TX34_9GAMM|nr:hypothetical protein [Pseudoalteromonas luteoviolacea]OCQ23857.1 hypothetical protein A7985_07930 [Pseudoalteromonas luteoviolacea]